MNETGELIEWNDDRGFGFVQPVSGSKLFVHISAFERPIRRPEIGDRLAIAILEGMFPDGSAVKVDVEGATDGAEGSIVRMSTPRSVVCVCESLLAICTQPSKLTWPVCAGPTTSPVTETRAGSVSAGRWMLSTLACARFTVTRHAGVLTERS